MCVCDSVGRGEGGCSTDHVQQEVDRLSVACCHLVCFLTDLQQAGGGQLHTHTHTGLALLVSIDLSVYSCVCVCVCGTYSQELLETVLDASLVDSEESSSYLVDGLGQAVDVVTVA